MAYAITLQTSDSGISPGDKIGILSYAASNESSGSDAITIAASIYAEAETEFTAASNKTAIVFALSSSGNNDISEKVRITSDGYLGINNNLPLYALDVNGSGNFSGNVTATRLIKSGGTSSQYLMADGSVSTVSAGNLTCVSGDLCGNLNLNNYDIVGTGDINVDGNITSSGFIKSGGTSSQFLKADGSVDGSTYAESSNNVTNYVSWFTGSNIRYYGGDTKDNIYTSTDMYFQSKYGMRFLTDAPAFPGAGTERLHLDTFEAVFNDGGNNYRFRIEGVSDTHLLFTDALENRVGIGTSTPAYKLDVAGSGNINTLKINDQYIFPTGLGSVGDSLVYAGSNQVVWSGVSGGGGTDTFVTGVEYNTSERNIILSRNDGVSLTGSLDIVLHSGDNISLLNNDAGYLTSLSGTTVVGSSGYFDVISFNVDDESILTKGQISWDDTEGVLDVGLTDTVTMHVGQHRFYRIRNQTGSTLYKGQVVYATGVHSNGIITPSLYIADNSIDEVRFIGVMLEDVNNNNNGYVIDFGHVEQIDLDGSATNFATGTETWVAGDILYAHPTVAGKLTNVKPKHAMTVAIILDVGTGNGNGRMFVRPSSYGDIADNHDVNTSGLIDNQFLVYDSGTDYWKPSSGLYYVDGSLGIGTATPQAKLDVNGTVQFDDLVRWEHPDKTLDTSTSTLGYMRLYDEAAGYCGLGVSASSFNIGSSGLINVRFMGGSGCLERAKINTAGDVIINENGYSTDFRVEGDTLEYLLHTDGSKDEVVIHNAVGYGLNYATSEGWVQATGTPTTSQVGYYGGDFNSNGSAENYIDYSDLPNGSRGLVWQSRDNGTDSGADGGWNKSIRGLDPNKTYVSIVYVRRTSSTSSGTFYHGCGQGGYTLNLDGSSNTNPYFHYISAGTLPQDVWCVSIGIIHANNDPTTSSSGFGGVYRLDTGTKIYSSSIDYRMAPTTTLQHHRTYLYYDATGNTDLDWCWPGFYEITADAVVGLLNTILYDHFSGRNITVNEDAGNFDFRVEGVSDTHLLFLDASTDSVGIGTALPTAKLEIADEITGSGTLLSLNGTSWGDGETTYLSWNRGGSYVANIGAELTGGAINAHIVFETAANAERMRITSDGKVGIGTASPSPAGGGTSLHIHDTNYPEIKLTNDNTGSTSDDGSVIQVVNSDLRFTNREDGNSISFYAFDTGGTSRQKLILSESLIAANGAKTNTDFQVKGELDDNLIRTDANINKVGIGCSPSLGKLHIQALYTNDASNDAIYIDQRNTSSSNGYYLNAGIDLLSRKLVNSGVSDTGQIIGADLVAVLDGNGSLTNSYGARTWGGIYINASGSLTNAWGIHPRVINGGHNGASITNAYGVDIQIDGDLYDRITGNSISNAYGLRIRDIEHATNSWAIYQEGANDANYFAGNVGIGTSSPSYKLDVNGTFSANSVNVNDQFTFPTTDGSGNQAIITDGNGNLSWQSVLLDNDLNASMEAGDGITLVYDSGTSILAIGLNPTGVFDSLSINNAFTFPTIDGSADQVLVTDGSGNITWQDQSGGSTSLATISVTSSQSLFNMTDSYSSGGLAVYLNGIKLVSGDDFTETSSTSFTLSSPAASGDIVEYVAYGSTVASTNLQKTGDTMTGNLTVNADLIVKGYKETHVDNGNTGTSQTISISNSTIQTYTLTGNCTFTMPTADAGRSFTMFLKTGAGSYTASFTNVKWPQNSAPTITASGTRMDILTFYSDGTNWYGNVAQDYHL